MGLGKGLGQQGAGVYGCTSFSIVVVVLPEFPIIFISQNVAGSLLRPANHFWFQRMKLENKKGTVYTVNRLRILSNCYPVVKEMKTGKGTKRKKELHIC